MSGSSLAPGCACRLCLAVRRLLRDGHQDSIGGDTWGWLVSSVRSLHSDLLDRLEGGATEVVTSGGGRPESAAAAPLAEGPRAATEENEDKTEDPGTEPKTAALPVKTEEPDFGGAGLETVKASPEGEGEAPEARESPEAEKPQDKEEKREKVAEKEKKQKEKTSKKDTTQKEKSNKPKKEKKEKKRRESTGEDEKKTDRKKSRAEEERSDSRESGRSAKRRKTEAKKSSSRGKGRAESSGVRKTRKATEEDEESGRERSPKEERSASRPLVLEENSNPQRPRSPDHSPPPHVRNRWNQDWTPAGGHRPAAGYPPAPPGFWGSRPSYWQEKKAKGRVRRERWQDIITYGTNPDRKRQREGR